MNKAFRIPRDFFASILPAVLMLLVVSTAWGRSPCGESVTVVRGDTLDGIARRCDTTVSALIKANPDIKNPDFIATGMELRIPVSEEPAREEPRPATPEEPESATSQYKISIEPDSGLPGTAVWLTAFEFPPDTEVLIGVGRLRSEYEIVGRERTNANGTLSTWTQVPEHASFGEEWVFVVALEEQRIDITSKPFTVRRPPGTPE